MISLNYTTEDRFSLYGIHHFIEKFGIPLAINKPSQSGIVIAYGGKTSGDFVIDLEEYAITNHVCGRICTQSEKIPVCEFPLDTGTEGEVIAYFENGTSRYPCITRSTEGVAIGIDIFKETGYLLSGHLDAIRPSLNTTIRKELAAKPVVDFLENLLFEAILLGCHERTIPLVRKSSWPEGKKFAVCLTHDVDEIKKTCQWISRPLRFLAQRDFGGFKGQVYSLVQKIMGKEPYNTYDDIISIEQDLGAKSTYFILKERGGANLFSQKSWDLCGRNRSLQSPAMKGLIQRLTANGDEIAMHGSSLSYNDPMMLIEETRELEQVIHEKVLGTRQHNLNLDVPATWIHQLGAGLRYDTTLGFRDTIGFRWGTTFPFFPNTGDDPFPLLEIPLTITDNCLESSNNKHADCIRITEEVERYNGALTLLWHPPVFNTLEYADERELYITINQYCRDNEAWIARARDIHDWYSLRNTYSFSGTYDPASKTYSIIPLPTGRDYFFTLYLPAHSDCVIRSGNADIIKRDGDRVYIKTHNLQDNNEVVLGIA
jgi:peptidoglycan/xylan/chitin deacetylase (PgdA/CDA1 family)